MHKEFYWQLFYIILFLTFRGLILRFVIENLLASEIWEKQFEILKDGNKSSQWVIAIAKKFICFEAHDCLKLDIFLRNL